MITATFGSAIIAPEGGFQMFDNDKYMSSLEAGELWDVSSSWVRRLCREGELKAIRIRNAWFIERDQPKPKYKRKEDV
jgi:hypothetical protein